MSDTNFDTRARRLEEQVYGRDKGQIRLALIKEDLEDFFPSFRNGGMKVLDAGGGAGHFARYCAGIGHKVVHCDISLEMLRMAAAANKDAALDKDITLVQLDLHDPSLHEHGPFDLVALHGVAEWTADPGKAIRQACSLVRPGGILSLLIFNRDKQLLKEGINGMLIAPPQAGAKRRTNLTPPGGLSPHRVRELLNEQSGLLLLQSGIRVFNGFFREIKPDLPPQAWLAQERLFYRQAPFSGLGEHSHFLWQQQGHTA
jgi:S-adenosylmethionine-dependent methyltransferase